MNNLNHTCYTLSRNSNRCDVCGARLPRLIDADALKKQVIKGGIYYGTDFIKIIDNAPTEERPKGEWLPKGRWHIDPQCIEYTCSICGRRIMREERLNVIEQYPFCHCGADMRGDV